MKKKNSKIYLLVINNKFFLKKKLFTVNAKIHTLMHDGDYYYFCYENHFFLLFVEILKIKS